VPYRQSRAQLPGGSRNRWTTSKTSSTRVRQLPSVLLKPRVQPHSPLRARLLDTAARPSPSLRSRRDRPVPVRRPLFPLRPPLSLPSRPKPAAPFDPSSKRILPSVADLSSRPCPQLRPNQRASPNPFPRRTVTPLLPQAPSTLPLPVLLGRPRPAKRGSASTLLTTMRLLPRPSMLPPPRWRNTHLRLRRCVLARSVRPTSPR
jgi:hypothetical protein